MPIRSFKRSLSPALLVAFALSAGADPATPGGMSITELMEHGRALQGQSHQNAQKVPAGDFPRPDAEMFQEYKQIGESLRRQGQTHLSQQNKQRPEDRRCDSAVTVIAVSRSLGEVSLREIFTEFAGRENTMVTFRGVPEGMDIGKSLIKLQKLAMEFDPMPTVQLDPTVFRRFDIQNVPEIVHLAPGEWGTDGCVRPLKARVKGITSPEFLYSRLERGEGGDFGVRGPVQPISEPDLIEVMQAKVQTINWDNKVEGAKGRMWDNIPLVSLPQATETQTRRVDASVVATRDIKAQDGTVIVPAGKRVNPLSMRPWTQSLIIFDPQDKEQKEIALWQAQIARDSNLKPVPFITSYDSSEGSRMLNELMTEFGTQVFVLSPDVASRFQLQVAPSVVTADATHFIVQEIHDLPTESGP